MDHHAHTCNTCETNLMDQQYSDLVLLIKQTCKCTKQACMYSGNICTLNKQASKVLLIETSKKSATDRNKQGMKGNEEKEASTIDTNLN